MIWLIASAVLTVSGPAWRLFIRRRGGSLPPAKRRWWRQIANTAAIMGLTALLLLFFRYERVPVFSARFWLLLWAAGGLARLSWLLWELKKRVSEDVAAYERRQRLTKYLPRRA